MARRAHGVPRFGAVPSANGMDRLFTHHPLTEMSMRLRMPPIVQPPSCHLFWLLILLLAFAGSLNAQEQDSLKKRFLVEAPRSWEALNAHVFQLQGRLTLESKWAKLSEKDSWEIKDKPGNRLSEREIINLDKQTKDYTVTCSNPDYIFTLKRKSPDVPWVLTDVQKKAPGKEFRLPDTYRDEGSLGYGVQDALISVCGMQLANLVREPSFRVLNAKLVRQDELELVQIDFENPHATNGATLNGVAFDPIQSGMLLLDPQQSWCLRGYEVHSKFSNSENVSRSKVIEIRNSSVPHLPLPVHVADTTTHQQSGVGTTDPPFTSSTDLKYDLDEPHPLVDADFRLPAFGLPEIVEVKRPWWSMWVVGGSLAIFAVAALGVWFYRRKASKPAA
jgi:hypothetical protein